jgi:hypothetical protein
MGDDRVQILKMLEGGQISTEQAVQLLKALDEADMTESAAEKQRAPASTDLPDRSSWWLYPTAAGAVIMAVGAPLMALGLTGGAALFWAVCCGWLPFLLGLGVLTLGVWSRGARWLHLRIRNADSGKRSFALSMPLPLTLAAGVLRIARPYVPQLRDTAIDEAILAAQEALRSGDDQPVVVDITDEDDGEQVLVYIG